MASEDYKLRQQLKCLGVDVGPITDTTRDLYKQVLEKKRSSSAHGSSNVKRGKGSKLPAIMDSGSLHKSVSSSKSAAKNNSPLGRNSTIGQGKQSWSLQGVSGFHGNSQYHVGKHSDSDYNVQGSKPKRPRLDVREGNTDEREQDMEITEIHAGASPVNAKQTHSISKHPRSISKYPCLYPTLPDEVNGELKFTPSKRNQVSNPILLKCPINPNKQNTPPPAPKPPLKVQSSGVRTPPVLKSAAHVRSPSNDSALSLSPPSPTPLVDSSSSDLVSIVTNFIGAGVRKIVDQIQGAASPRRSIHKASRRNCRKVSFNRSESGGESPISPGASPSPQRRLPKDRGQIPISDLKLCGEIHSPVNPMDVPDSPEPNLSPKAKDDGENYDWELMPSDVEICKKPNGLLWKLGGGGFGDVYKGLKDAVDEVAIKIIRIQNSPIAKEQFKREIDIISKLRHRHILQFYGACIQPSSLYMVTELMQTDLFSVLRHDIRYLLSGLYGREVLLGVASGLHYLHSRRPPVVHRDIKSPNILLMDGVAKIADVGIARTKSDSDMTAQKGFTMAWAAPEVVYRKRATEKIDIWSFGVIIWEVVSGKMPCVGYLELPTSAPPSLRSLYELCVNDDPSNRPSAAEVVQQLKSTK